MNSQKGYLVADMDTETPLLVVAIVGVTSPQGDGVARKFLSLRDWQVRAVTDEEAEEKVTELAEWAAKGVNVVRADFHDPGNLAMAFAGADAIFCATSFTRLFVEHSTISWYSLTKINPANLVRQFESSRNQNVIQAASLIPTLQKMVLSVDPSPKHFSAGRITHAYHMDAKWEAMKVLKLKYPILAQKTSILQVGRFMDRYKLYLQKVSKVQFLCLLG
jgi:putative NADH-flavin reductase